MAAVDITDEKKENKLTALQEKAVRQKVEDNLGDQIVKDKVRGGASWAENHPDEYRKNAYESISQNSSVVEQVTEAYARKLMRESNVQADKSLPMKPVDKEIGALRSN